MELTNKDRQRFLKYILPSGSGCIEWQGYRDPKGYGRFQVCRIPQLAHRVSWFLAGRTLTSEAPVLRHSCDNPACVNVEHLRPGTQGDNLVDMASSLRGRRGAAGLPYVTRSQSGKRFEAYIHIGSGKARKHRYVGTFDTPEEASAAAIAVRRAASSGE